MAEYVVVFPFDGHKVGDVLQEAPADMIARNYAVRVRRAGGAPASPKSRSTVRPRAHQETRQE